MTEPRAISSSKEDFAAFLHGLSEFRTPIETISELPKHEKVDANGSWTEAEMESELLYWVQLYLTHLACPMEFLIPCARAIVTDVFDGSFRPEDFQASPSQLIKIDGSAGGEWGAYGFNGDHDANGHHGNSDGLEVGSGDGAHKDHVPTAPALSAKNLFSHAVVKANELLSRWKTDPPKLEPTPMPHEVSIYSTRNKRPGMEDRHIVIPDLRAVVDLKGIKSPVSFYAVYDGHAGSIAASYAAAHLHRLFCTSKHFPEHMDEALKESFVATDLMYKVKGQRDHDYSGTTAVVSVVYEKKLYIAWVGDSEAAIVLNGEAEKLVEPRHVAGNEGERTRVQNEGGSVIMNQGGWRVAAVLTVTRAIGDTGFKPFVTASPDVRTVDLTGNEDYLIVACDGLWDELTPQDAMRETNHFLLDNPHSFSDVAKSLSEKARRSGSMDNITVLVIMLKPLEIFLEELRDRGAAQLAKEDFEKRVSFAVSTSSQDDFADLADATELSDVAELSGVEFDTSSENPFDTTPLDPAVLGDFGTPGTPDQSATSETEWKYQRSPQEPQTHVNSNPDGILKNAPEPQTRVYSSDRHDIQEHEALHVLDQAIDGVDLHSPIRQELVQLLDLDDSSFGLSTSDDHAPDDLGKSEMSDGFHGVGLQTAPQSQERDAAKVPDFVHVFDQPPQPASVRSHDRQLPLTQDEVHHQPSVSPVPMPAGELVPENGAPLDEVALKHIKEEEERLKKSLPLDEVALKRVKDQEVAASTENDAIATRECNTDSADRTLPSSPSGRHIPQSAPSQPSPAPAQKANDAAKPLGTAKSQQKTPPTNPKAPGTGRAVTTKTPTPRSKPSPPAGTADKTVPAVSARSTTVEKKSGVAVKGTPSAAGTEAKRLGAAPKAAGTPSAKPRNAEGVPAGTSKASTIGIAKSVSDSKAGSAVQTNESVAKKPAASPRNLPRPLQSLSRIVPKPPVPADQKAHVVSAANKVEEKLQVEAGPNDVSQGLPTASSNCKTETGKKPPVPARSTPPAKPRPTTALKAAPEHPAPSARKEPEQKPGNSGSKTKVSPTDQRKPAVPSRLQTGGAPKSPSTTSPVSVSQKSLVKTSPRPQERTQVGQSASGDSGAKSKPVSLASARTPPGKKAPDTGKSPKAPIKKQAGDKTSVQDEKVNGMPHQNGESSTSPPRGLDGSMGDELGHQKGKIDDSGAHNEVHEFSRGGEFGPAGVGGVDTLLDQEASVVNENALRA